MPYILRQIQLTDVAIRYQSFTKWRQVLRYLKIGDSRYLPHEPGFHGTGRRFCGASECLTSVTRQAEADCEFPNNRRANNMKTKLVSNNI